jgi:bacterial/archaeal transporter family-2 protein
VRSVPSPGQRLRLRLVIFGQLAASLLLDHYGALAAAPHPVNALRLTGATMVLGGALMVLKA